MTENRLPPFPREDNEETLRPLHLHNEPTQTIDLGGLFSRDVTATGSFDVKAGLWASTFGKLLQSLPIPAFLIDQALRIMVANQAVARISPNYEIVQGGLFEDLFPRTSEANNASKCLAEVFHTRKPRSMEGVLRIEPGTIWARLTFRSLRIADMRCVLVLTEDLTNERKLLRMSQEYQQKLEKRVEQRTVELTRMNTRLRQEMAERKRAEDMLVRSERLRAVGEMSAGVAHNFKNLVQMLLAFTHGALTNLETGDHRLVREELENILQSLHHGTQTVTRLQEFAKLGSDQFPLVSEVFDLSTLVKQAVEFTKPFWQTYPQSQGIEVNLDVNLRDACFVEGNQGQLFEVVVNLIKNAAEALTRGGHISLTTATENNHVVFEVRDTGVGISEAELGRLFTPFFTTKADAGTGLGLATSRGIVDNHKGSISVRSVSRQGTVFTVTLPLASQDRGQGQTETPAAKALGRQRTILAIDDMESSLMMLKIGLETYAQKVLAAGSGDMALKIFQEQPVDLVLCDLAMPGINGWEVGSRIKRACEEKSTPKPPFILFTAWSVPSSDKAKMADSGVDAILEKPVDIPRLMQFIADMTK